MDEDPDGFTILDPFSEGRETKKRLQPLSSDSDCGLELPDPFATFVSKSATDL